MENSLNPEETRARHTFMPYALAVMANPENSALKGRVPVEIAEKQRKKSPLGRKRHGKTDVANFRRQSSASNFKSPAPRERRRAQTERHEKRKALDHIISFCGEKTTPARHSTTNDLRQEVFLGPRGKTRGIPMNSADNAAQVRVFSAVDGQLFLALYW